MQIDFCKKKSRIDYISSRIKKFVFKKISRSSMNLFFLGKDSISVDPQINGSHEPDLTNLINWCALNLYSDFLIDIGANIGLTSCQNGKAFKSVFCFEPNPLLSSILKANAEITLDMSKVSIFDFGLGSANESLELMIPKNNWSGAFVVSPDNHYSDDILASKDRFSKIELDNYLIKKVEIRSAKAELSKIFNQFSDADIARGVIKIDIEGMEEVVLKEIAESLPQNIHTIIIFENWDPNFDFSGMVKVFYNRKVKLQKLTEKMSYNKNWPTFVKAFFFLLNGKTLQVNDLSNCEDKCGDIIIQIE